jgi:formylglycine-generating enzyme required for sulfatase activity
MVVVLGQKFNMGSPTDELGHEEDEGPQRMVEVKTFAVSRYEITADQWGICVQYGGCVGGTGKPLYPVTQVNWTDAEQYASWLSQITGAHYRLLSEAEWEFAARAGTTTRYSWGPGIGPDEASCQDCNADWDERQLSKIGSYKPNNFGLYDMSGNVWEWVKDCYHANYVGAPPDQTPWTEDCTDARRMTRGGSWSSPGVDLRVANRDKRPPDASRSPYIGVRIARDIIAK